MCYGAWYRHVPDTKQQEGGEAQELKICTGRTSETRVMSCFVQAAVVPMTLLPCPFADNYFQLAKKLTYRVCTKN